MTLLKTIVSVLGVLLIGTLVCYHFCTYTFNPGAPMADLPLVSPCDLNQNIADMHQQELVIIGEVQSVFSLPLLGIKLFTMVDQDNPNCRVFIRGMEGPLPSQGETIACEVRTKQVFTGNKNRLRLFSELERVPMPHLGIEFSERESSLDPLHQ